MCNEARSMRNLIVIVLLFLSNAGFTQTIDSINYKTALSGVWTLNFCDSLWNIEDWICVDTLTFLPNGQVNSVRTCERPEGYPDDEVYDPILLDKVEWTRYDQNTMKLYYKYYQEWDDSWSKELEHYRVIAITKNEIRAECDAYSESEPDQVQILRVLYQRVK